MKRSLIALCLCALLVAAASATAVDTPSIPDLQTPKADEVARFEVTVRGSQSERTTFYREPILDGCSMHLEGTLNEDWVFNRNKSVVMEFSKFGKRIFVQRAKRQFGDAAFATKGEIKRTATGFHKFKLPDSCLTYPLPGPDCGLVKKAPLDLRLGYSSGKLTLEASGPSAGKPNPSEKCGIAPDGANFNNMSFPYPHLFKQKGKLSRDRIFGDENKFSISLKDRFIQPADESGLTTFTETLSGLATVDFKRL